MSAPSTIGERKFNKASLRRPFPNKVLFWSPECRYEVILSNVRALHRSGQSSNGNDGEGADNDSLSVSGGLENCQWKLIDDLKLEQRVNIYWIDVALIHERFRSIQPWQIINHFPGMPNIARKNRMGQNLNRMLKMFPKEYSFYPKTWVLPGELADFKQQFDSQGNALNNKIFIIKPDTGCQGRGIFLTRTYDSVPQNENVVAQVYIKKPLLLDGFKFDLRVYCLVASVKPLRMYLFQDGLVRMCTEEYVKPNKYNLSQSCMHLTNYAVNKHNANFQQPTAAATEAYESDDCGSKRTLKWFMQHIAQEHGEAKANWLWKRMGVLCVRTILAIMPTLSREYDQHFKSFTGIPSQFNPSMAEEGGDDKKPPKENENSENAASGAESTAENTAKPSSSQSGPSVSSSYPKLRGSRCFEILGFDIMIDSNLRPVIIEVNHLPSFGTDSPLDLDVKDRLMKQSMEAIAALPDDEQVYAAYHKQQASKRLLATREVNKDTTPPPPQIKKPPQPTAKKTLAQPIPNKRNTTPSPMAGASMLASSQSPLQMQPPKAPPRISEPVDTGYCKPSRFEEIKEILAEVYEQHCPEKVSKIDRLLARYESREEEFLKYVYSKYSITPPWMLQQKELDERYQQELLLFEEYQNQLRAQQEAHREAEEVRKAQIEAEKEHKEGDGDDDTADDSNRGQDEVGAEMEASVRQGRDKPSATSDINPAKRTISRSLSPPSSKNSRVLPSWKMQADEEFAYREEVSYLHIPREDDEWMQREMRFLTQFTRIFPPLKSSAAQEGLYFKNASSSPVDVNAETASQSDEDDEEEDNEQKDAIGGAAQTASYKPTAFEEILYQVFLQDKRQTMRLRCPLPRLRTEGDTQSLPPLDNRSKGHLYGSISANAGKNAVGWKLPSTIKKDSSSNGSLGQLVSKQPTQSQLDAADRLSKGLSVNNSIDQYKYLKQKKTHPPKYIHPSVVMDQRPMPIPTQLISLQSIPVPISAPGASINSIQVNVTQTRIRYEDLDKMQSSASTAVLKQQLFHFDSNKISSEAGSSFGDSLLVQSNSSKSAHRLAALPGNPHNRQHDDQISKEALLKQLFPGWF